MAYDYSRAKPANMALSDCRAVLALSEIDFADIRAAVLAEMISRNILKVSFRSREAKKTLDEVIDTIATAYQAKLATVPQDWLKLALRKLIHKEAQLQIQSSKANVPKLPSPALVEEAMVSALASPPPAQSNLTLDDPADNVLLEIQREGDSTASTMTLGMDIVDWSVSSSAPLHRRLSLARLIDLLTVNQVIRSDTDVLFYQDKTSNVRINHQNVFSAAIHKGVVIQAETSLNFLVRSDPQKRKFLVEFK